VGAFQETESGETVEDPGKFADFRHIGLAEKHGFLRVDPAGEKIDCKAFDPVFEVFRFRVRGHRMIIGDEEETFALVSVLEVDTLFHRSEIVADVRDARRLDSCQNAFHD